MSKEGKAPEKKTPSANGPEKKSQGTDKDRQDEGVWGMTPTQVLLEVDKLTERGRVVAILRENDPALFVAKVEDHLQEVRVRYGHGQVVPDVAAEDLSDLTEMRNDLSARYAELDELYQSVSRRVEGRRADQKRKREQEVRMKEQAEHRGWKGFFKELGAMFTLTPVRVAGAKEAKRVELIVTKDESQAELRKIEQQKTALAELMRQIEDMQRLVRAALKKIK